LRRGTCLVTPALCLDVFGNAGRFRDSQSIGSQAVDMEPDRVANIAFDRRNRLAGRDATRAE
jgi:hypothetical protein